MMFEPEKGIAFGVSTTKTSVSRNAEVKVYIWLSNETEAPQNYYLCCGLTFLRKLDVVDVSGVRLVP